LRLRQSLRASDTVRDVHGLTDPRRICPVYTGSGPIQQPTFVPGGRPAARDRR
jgi:hypothetical protein